MKQAIGAAMIATQFLGLAVYSVCAIGWIGTLAAFGVVAGTVTLVTVGTALLEGKR